MLLTNIPEFIFFKEVASLVALKLWLHCHGFSIGLRSRLEPFYAKRDKTKWLHLGSPFVLSQRFEVALSPKKWLHPILMGLYMGFYERMF